MNFLASEMRATFSDKQKPCQVRKISDAFRMRESDQNWGKDLPFDLHIFFKWVVQTPTSCFSIYIQDIRLVAADCCGWGVF